MRIVAIALCFLSLIAFLPPGASSMPPVKQKAISKQKKHKKYRPQRQRRRSDTRKGKQQAMMFLQAYEDLAKLAGLPYKPPTDQQQLQQMVNEDGEVLTDTEAVAMLPETDTLSWNPADYDITTFREQWDAYIAQFEDEEMTEAGVEKKALLQSILEWIGTPYRYGGTTRRGIDCSALVQHVYRKAADVQLPRTARYQYLLGQPIENIDDLRFGDLVFFHTRRAVYVSHVGIYLGHGLFAHASSRYGVTVSSLESPYYRKRFIGGRRLRVDDLFNLQAVTAGQTQ